MQEETVDIYCEDEPYENVNKKTPEDESINLAKNHLTHVKENNRHDEVKETLKLANNLVTISIFFVIGIWGISVWLSPEQQNFSNGVIEILKIVIMTTIGFICGNKIK